MSLSHLNVKLPISAATIQAHRGTLLSDEKHDDSFKVVDRRLFTPEGELRPDAIANERREQEVAAAIKAATPSPALSPTTSGAAPAPAADAPRPSHSFQLLVDFIARNAAMLLGGYADPQTGQAILDLEGAREMIDMLDALREKTRGNLAPEEESLLLELLGSLKMSFLEMNKAAAQAMKEKAKGKA